MQVIKKYVVYEYIQIDSGYTLMKLEFLDWTLNPFNTEEEAIQALINENKKYQNFAIIKEVQIKDDI